MDTITEIIDLQALRNSGAQKSTSPPKLAAKYSVPQSTLLQMLRNDLHRLNQTIADAVEEGMTVELVRRSRYHATSGSWGDQMIPVITLKP